MKNNFLYLLLLCVPVFFVFDASIRAQDLDDVTIGGRVLDSNNASIPGATVTATLTGNGIARTVVANDEGRYRIVELPPGIYSLRVSMQGFAAQEKTNLETVAGQNVRLDFNLAPAGVSAEQIVTLEGGNEPVIDTARTIVGGTITAREIEDIPTSARNPLDLVLTLGGTSEEALSTRDLSEDRNVTNATAPAEQGNFSLSGGASYSNNVTIDGLDNNDDRSANVRFTPSLETVEEVQVVTNQFSAEYGRASGGRVNFRTRSGTNRFRGRVFMFFRDARLNANTWYNNSRGFERLPFTEYNPGFTLSGPVMLPKLYDGRNRTFFSVGYEYLRLQDTTFINTWVPASGSNPRFPLPAGNGNCPLASCADANSSPAVALAPYTALFPTPNVAHIFTAKVDRIVNRQNNFTVGYQMGRRKNRRTTAASVTRLDDALQARTADSDAINFTDNHVFNSRLVNQFRFQYSVFEPSYQTDQPFAPVVLIGYRNPETGGNQTLIVGNSTASGGNSETFPQNRRETRFQYQDTLTYVVGEHSLKFGFDIQKIRSKATELSDATGTFSFANFGTFQQNVPSRFRLNFGTGSDVRNAYWSAFGGDEFKLRPNLTVSAGLRYERETSVADADNFGPRLGIAWSPFKDNKGVIRFGAGIFYNRALLRTIADFIQNVNGIVQFDTNSIRTDIGLRDPVLAAIAQRFPDSFASEAELRALVASVCATVSSSSCNGNTGFLVNQGDGSNPLRSVDPDLKIPESYQFNLGFEREISKNWVFEANYTWNRTIKLWRDRNINAPRLEIANARLGENYASWTEYLLDNSFVFRNAATNAVVRTYTFQTSAASTANFIGSCTVNSASCVVNLNASNGSSALPAIAVPGVNNNAVGAPIGIALAAIAQFRPNPNFEEQSRIGSIGRAFYHGLILEVRSRYRKFGGGFGSSFRFNYTLSSTMDDGLNNTANAQINGDFESEFARTVTDRRHRVNFSGAFDTPFWLGKLRFSPLLRYGSSAPFSIGIGGSDRNLDDLGTDRPNFGGDLSDIVYSAPGTFNQALFSRFSLPVIGSRGGDLPRSAGSGPSFFTFDLSVSREFKFTERMRLRPVVEFDNVLNAAVFNFGAAFVDYTGTNFLVPSRTFRQRQIRLGARFDF